MRLLLDEMFSSAVERGLRKRALDATAIQEMPALRGLPDIDVFVAAQLDQRVTVTENIADFMAIELAWRAEHEQPHAGLVLVAPRAFPRHQRRVTGRLVDALFALASTGRPEPGTIAWLEGNEKNPRSVPR